MHVNLINTQTNIAHKANFDIVGDKTLMTAEQMQKLKNKASHIGNSTDYIAVGITQVKPKILANINPAVYLNENIKQINDTYTKISAACHTFFWIPKPSFIKDVADIFGSRTERAEKSFKTIDTYLNEVEQEVNNLRENKSIMKTGE